MKASTKKALYVATVCIVLGALLLLTVGINTGFHIENLSTTVTAERGTREITETFTAIHADTIGDLRLVPSEDGRCQVEYGNSEEYPCEITVKNGTLTIDQRNNSKWYRHIGFMVWTEGDFSVTVTLPAAQYRALTAESTSSDLTVAEGFTFDTAEFTTASGDLAFYGDARESLRLKTTSGELFVRGVTADTVTLQTVSGDLHLEELRVGALNAKSTSGELHVRSLEADSLTAETVSGDIRVANAQITGEARLDTTSGDVLLEGFEAGTIRIETVSGDIDLEAVDASALTLKSTSGEVTGTLLTGKDFTVNTTSGSVHLPSSADPNGTCQITTTSGDIRIGVA